MNFRSIFFATLAIAGNVTASEPPDWLTHAGGMRASDPALGRGGGRVQWREWNAESFTQAAREKKLVFVFVTANWCHGGQEMERTSLSDVETATRLNKAFVPIKLDRERFPELDLRLQQASAMLTNARGWPLSVVMTSDGELLFGGTFMPIQDDFQTGKPGFRSTLKQLANTWQADGTRISIEAGRFMRAVKKDAQGRSYRASVPRHVLDLAAAKLDEQFDRESGAFREPGTTRFPAPRALELLLQHHARTGAKKSLEIVTRALDAMLRGGIYDQLEGGFHRFSTDRNWRVPRFEKLPVMNAELVNVLLHAWQTTGEPRYRTAVEETLAFWISTLDTRGEFFCASVAAQARSFEEGHYYTWTVAEFERVFSDAIDLRLAQTYFGVDDTGDQPQTAPGRNVLYEAKPLDEVARRLNLEPADARARLDRVRALLCAERRRRPAPALDRTPLCDANAMLAAAFIEAGRVLKRDDLRLQGLRTLQAILVENGKPRAVRHVLNDPNSAPLLMDEAARAWACEMAFESEGDGAYWQQAQAAIERIERDYHDILGGGYNERSARHEPAFAKALNWRAKSMQDTSEPSSNGLTAHVFVRAYALTGEEHYKEMAETAVASYGKLLGAPGVYDGTLTAAADALEGGTLSVKIFGKADDAVAAGLLAAAVRAYVPWKCVQRFDSLEAAGEVAPGKADTSRAFALVRRKGETKVVATVEELTLELK